MSITRIASQDCNASGAGGVGTVTLSFPVATTPGNLLVVWGNATNPNSNAVTAPGWIVIQAAINTTNSTIFIAYKISTGDTSVTFTQGVSGNHQTIGSEFNSGSPNIETQNTSTSGATTVIIEATGTITTANAGDLIAVCASQQATNGGAAAWTTATTIKANAENKLIAGAYIPGTTLTSFTDTATWTTLRQSSTIVVAFKPITLQKFYYSKLVGAL